MTKPEEECVKFSKIYFLPPSLGRSRLIPPLDETGLYTPSLATRLRTDILALVAIAGNGTKLSTVNMKIISEFNILLIMAISFFIDVVKIVTN